MAAPVSKEEALALFIGEQYTNYYSYKFSDKTWNWAAFFGQWVWFAYRKMYRLATLVALSSLVMLLFNLSIFMSVEIDKPLLFAIGVFTLFIPGVCASEGNRFYKRFCLQKVEQILATPAENKELREMLKEEGGTDEILAWGLGIGTALPIIAVIAMWMYLPR